MRLRYGRRLLSMRRHAFDPRYLEDAHEPMDTAEFDGLVREDTRWTSWEGWR